MEGCRSATAACHTSADHMGWPLHVKGYARSATGAHRETDRLGGTTPRCTRWQPLGGCGTNHQAADLDLRAAHGPVALQ
jgi:hypothetical protein